VQWGPNLSVDPVVTRFDETTEMLQVLVVRRKDAGEWALPGAICMDGESLGQAAKRKIKEIGAGLIDGENELEQMITQLFDDGKFIFKGHVDDPRNVDNAWLETTAMHFHCSDGLGAKLLQKAEGKTVRWIDASEKMLCQMYANHSDFVRIAVDALQGWKLESWCESLLPQDLIATSLRMSAPSGLSELKYMSSFRSREEVAAVLMKNSESLLNGIIDRVWEQSQVSRL